jgi:hypothetical protein
MNKLLCYWVTMYDKYLTGQWQINYNKLFNTVVQWKYMYMPITTFQKI